MIYVTIEQGRQIWGHWTVKTYLFQFLFHACHLQEAYMYVCVFVCEH